MLKIHYDSHNRYENETLRKNNNKKRNSFQSQSIIARSKYATTCRFALSRNYWVSPELPHSIPFKKKKGQSLTTKEKSHNKTLSKKRILIENVNRQCKIFRIVKDIYRGKHKSYALNWHLIAAIVNLWSAPFI